MRVRARILVEIRYEGSEDETDEEVGFQFGRVCQACADPDGIDVIFLTDTIERVE